MKRISFILHAISPLHCGTGQGVDTIDLPIARMRATGIPIVPGSSLKGVMRSHADEKSQQTLAVYGPETMGASENAGALVVGDARLLCLPVRSFIGTFAWVTSPLLLHLASRDLSADRSDVPAAVPTTKGREGYVVPEISQVLKSNRVYLEDIDLKAQPSAKDGPVSQWAQFIANLLPENEREMFRSRFIVVDDETMTFLWETATQIDARNRINAQGTVVDGALWYEESLPPETLMIGQLAAENSRRKDIRMSANEVLAFALPPGKSHVLQIGGKATVGRGLCRLYAQLPQN